MKGTSGGDQEEPRAHGPDSKKRLSSSSSADQNQSRSKSSSRDPSSRRVSSGSKHLQPGGMRDEERVEVLGVTVAEKHGVLYNAIPCMPLPVAIVCCVFNIVVPGLGTFISAWTSLCGCRTRLGAPAKAFGLNLLAAFCQMVTFVLIVGWVWSIIWGMNFVQIAMSAGEPQKIPYYVRRQSSVE